MDALYDCGFVVAGDFLEWQHTRSRLADNPALIDTMDIHSIQMVLTSEALMDYEIGGRFSEFTFNPILPLLLRRIATLHDLPLEPDTNA
jgi:hypothetical protein